MEQIDYKFETHTPNKNKPKFVRTIPPDEENRTNGEKSSSKSVPVLRTLRVASNGDRTVNVKSCPSASDRSVERSPEKLDSPAYFLSNMGMYGFLVPERDEDNDNNNGEHNRRNDSAIDLIISVFFLFVLDDDLPKSCD
ncbi:hypothetical protein GWI33_004659 [Rhynchophorus ferrugineus]|uniref:Uncharacterized protein n=1 Tax=Rhynchophorus ferrugineus TaxID=354439 RepID=A0A834IX09_RHYFE|nr:hypothetical protein GWI33_004659 [Rhynchophorus ferrugineus]